LSQLAITSSVCCPSFGAGFNSGGLPSKRTGVAASAHEVFADHRTIEEEDTIVGDERGYLG
jgi:hypothetical protein